ncbi:MAG: DUF5050 domain-containing protein [Firmicutes bacterium]|nr:DUF5050 domain-containing protein [Bacillota bacterium]
MASDFLVLQCKSCGSPLKVSGTQSFVQCEYCHTNTSTQIVEKDAHISDINTVPAAAVHINLTLGKTDWDELATDPSAVTVEELDSLLAKIKRTAGDKPETWEMCFIYVHACVTKKLESISKMIPILVRDYVVRKNYNTCENTFDALKQSVTAIMDRRTSLTAELNEYYNNAQQHKLAVTRLKAMKSQLDELLTKLDGYSIPATLTDVPEVKEEIERAKKQLVNEYQEKGIDLMATFKQAVASFENGDLANAVKEFSSISRYAPALNYIERINYNFRVQSNNKEAFFLAGGEIFLEKENFQRVYSEELFSNTATPVKSIVRIYGDLAYYIRGNAFNSMKLDINTKIKKGVQLLDIKEDFTLFYGDVSLAEDFDGEYNKAFNTAEDILLEVRAPLADNKELIKSKKDFFKANKISEAPEFINASGNKFVDLWRFNFETKEFTLVLQNIDGLVENKDGNLYYIEPIVQAPVKKKMACKVSYGLSCLGKDGVKSSNIIEGKARIQEFLSGGDILFTRQVATSGNYSKNNLEIVIKNSSGSEEERVIARNVFGYHDYHGGKILYTVGNEKIKTLYSYDLATEKEIELEKYLKNLSFVFENWLYLVVGEKNFFSIKRMPLEGGKWETVVPSAKKLVAVNDEHESAEASFVKNGRIFYQDHHDSLCSVRLNGTGILELVRGFDDILCVTANKIFFTAMDDGNIKSIYIMNFDGSMRKKLHYGIHFAQNFFAEKIYFTQTVGNKNLFDLYAGVAFPKFRKTIDKIQAKRDKKGKNTIEENISALFTLDCNKQSTEFVAGNKIYPTKDGLKALAKRKN